MQNKDFMPSSDVMELIDERLAIILKRFVFNTALQFKVVLLNRDLSDHLSLLKTWECKG